jgi:hypothetical protein
MCKQVRDFNDSRGPIAGNFIEILKRRERKKEIQVKRGIEKMHILQK